MPDIQMCLGQDCKVARNCYRCPQSGTVSSGERQAWGPIPGEDASCPLYLPVNPDPQAQRTVFDAIWSVTTYFVAVYGSTSTAQYAPMEMFKTMANAYWHAIAFNEANEQAADDICKWFTDTFVDDTDVYSTIRMHLIAVVSILDTNRGDSHFADELQKLLSTSKSPHLIPISATRH